MSKKEHIQTNLFEINSDAIPDISSLFAEETKPEKKEKKQSGGVTT